MLINSLKRQSKCNQPVSYSLAFIQNVPANVEVKRKHELGIERLMHLDDFNLLYSSIGIKN